VDIRPTAGLEGDIVQADLTDLSAAIQVADGVDAIVHLAGIPDEAPFDDLVQANIVATFNVLEAARQTHVSRVVLASSNHVVGFYPRTTRVGPHDPVRPDSLYAVTKSFGETLGRLYHDKYGLQVVCLRIGSFRQQPQNKRQLSTWLSPGDATRLLCRSIDAEDVGFAVVFGCSRVHPSWWDNPDAVQIGWEPIDDVGAYEMSLETQTEEAGIGSVVQGGFFADPAYRGGLG
jgi:uronate dehydrogenase